MSFDGTLLRLAADERRVLRARVRPATPGGAWALRQALEDALRCASFDDAGRLVLVRRLRLSAVPAGVGNGVLTRAVEQAWRAAARMAVPALEAGDAATAPEAAQAPAVWFASHADAVLSALARTVEAAPMRAWFWPLAVPGLEPVGQGASPVGRGRDLLARLQVLAPMAWPQALARWPPQRLRVLAAWAPELAAQGLLQGVRPVAWPSWDRPVLGAAEAAAQVSAGKVGGGSVSLHGGASGAVPMAKPPGVWEPPPGAVARQGPASPLVASKAEGAPAAQRYPAQPPAPAAHAIEAGLGPVPQPAAVPAAGGANPAIRPPGVPTDSAALCSPAASPALPASPATAGTTASPPLAGEGTAPSHATPPQGAGPRWRMAPSGLPWLHEAAFSHHAGALWLVNLLDGVGFGAARPGAGQVAAVLQGLFRTAGLPQDDPQHALLQHDAPPVPATDPNVRGWQRRARRALRRHAQLSVAELTCRPGWLALTLTHADVVLPLDAVDLRVRRCGLDRDPGYVPWLGRILRFHFIARADFPDIPDFPAQEAGDA